MAKYTTLLAEYLKRGGALPASFSLIEGFEDIFKKHFCDHEIGFETDLLFFMKLDEKADLFMQPYADKIARLASAWLTYDAPAKVIYTTENKTFNGGETKATTTELPIDSDEAEANLINKADAYKNTENRGTQVREEGETHDEAQKAIDFLNTEVKPLILKLLNEFEPCFMQVY